MDKQRLKKPKYLDMLSCYYSRNQNDERKKRHLKSNENENCGKCSMKKMKKLKGKIEKSVIWRIETKQKNKI